MHFVHRDHIQKPFIVHTAKGCHIDTEDQLLTDLVSIVWSSCHTKREWEIRSFDSKHHSGDTDCISDLPVLFRGPALCQSLSICLSILGTVTLELFKWKFRNKWWDKFLSRVSKKNRGMVGDSLIPLAASILLAPGDTLKCHRNGATDTMQCHVCMCILVQEGGAGQAKLQVVRRREMSSK